jgi:4-amino-4-deoxy-L-arabinose transferase-like glycosyltransferase
MKTTPLLAAAAALFIFTAGLGRLPLIDPDEGRYARTAQEMIQRDDYVVPWFEGQPRLQKPVLFYWLEAAAFRTLGFTELAARLPSAMAALGTILWVYLFVRPRLGGRSALMACAVLATTPLFYAMARTATTDMTLTFFVFGAAVSLYEGLAEPVRRFRHLIVAGVCLGLGLLTKGPVALLIPFVAVSVALAARKRAPITVAGRAVTVAWIMVAVALPWAALLIHRVGWEHVLEIWRRETLERYAGGLDHPESPLYFFLTAPLVLFPWSALLPLSVFTAARQTRRGEGLRPFLLTWAVGGFVFFTLGKGKLDSYLLPLTPAFAILVAGCATPELSPRSSRSAVWTAVAIAAGILVPMHLGSHLQQDPLALPAMALFAAAAALLTGVLAATSRQRTIVPALGGVIAVTLIGGALFVPEELADLRSTRTLVSQADLRDRPEPVYAHRIMRPSLGFYLQRSATVTKARHVLLKTLADGRPASVIVEEKRGEVVLPLLTRGFRVVARRQGVLVMRRTSGP